MSYVSVFKSIPELLSQPTGIAAIASVGIHGAIALIVPLMPVNSNQQQDSSSQNTVGVVEINPADQIRLPENPGSNPVALQAQLPLLQNQFPQQPQLQLQTPPSLNAATTTLPPLPPPVAAPLSLPPIQTIPENYRIAALPQRQPLRISPRRNFQIDNSGFNAARNRFTPVTPRSFDDKAVVPTTSTPLPVDNLPELSAAKLPDNLPDNLPATPVNTNPNPATTQPRENIAKVAPIGKTPTVGDELAFANQSIPKWQQGSTLNLPDVPSKQTEQTEVTQVNSYARLRAALQQQYPNSQEKTVIRKTISTDKPGLEGIVLGVLVVDAEGKVLDIQFQDRAVAPELQLKTREYFTQNAPKAEKQISRYPFSLRFQNDGSNAAEASQDKTPAVVLPKTSETSAENEAQPQPSPAVTIKPLPVPQVNKN
ncbi:hypothetical protein, partial [Anabaena sp. CA = ATCC 33047]|uniref:hypothetical protein n=1 Tax=Anabaena sp. (strain CA / ATCC 33047) TaxID=52271 RepID=UPI00082D2D98